MRLPVGPYATSIAAREMRTCTRSISLTAGKRQPAGGIRCQSSAPTRSISTSHSPRACGRSTTPAASVAPSSVDEDAIGDDRARRRQVAVHADVARERAQLRAGADEVDAEREVGRGETIGGARAHRDVAVVEPRLDAA